MYIYGLSLISIIEINDRLEAIKRFRFKTEDGSTYSIFDFIYPVGCLYWSNSDTNPSKLFGGTWKQITDTFILAKGSKFNTNGGNEKISISLDNIKKQSIRTEINGNVSMAVFIDSNGYDRLYNAITNMGNSYLALTEGKISASGTGHGTIFKQTAPFKSGTDIAFGKDNPDKFSIMPPYQVKYCFERIA